MTYLALYSLEHGLECMCKQKFYSTSKLKVKSV